MKTILPLICLTLMSVGLITSSAHGQIINGNTIGAGQPGVSPFQTSVRTNWPGRYWFGVNLADEGFGYSGSYGSIGAKTRLFEDFFDGRWLVEARGHVSLDRGDLFGNVGIERVFSVDAAGADVVFGVWYDRDNDQPGAFAHSMDQVAFNAAIRTRQFDLYGNGYLPVGTTNYSQGDPTSSTPFLNNVLVILPGIDSALEGFDANLRVRPDALAMVNGSAEVGLYTFSSDLVESFTGVRTRMGMQAFQGMMVNLDLNYDERFDFTAGLSLGWMFGGFGPGGEYAGLGRDLERASRPDHITRFQQDLVLAVDPDTGLPYTVFHVDNTAGAGGTGSFESRFDTLAAAEAAAGTDAIVFVHNGDGTNTNLNTGFVMKDRQLLLGDGVSHTIDVVGGQFTFSNDLDGLRPIITNNGVGVTLANNNTVRGLIIDGAGAALTHGISGNAIAGGTIDNVTIRNGPLLNGINLTNTTGDWSIARSDITTAGNDGIFIQNALDATSTFNFDTNTVSNNTRDGIHMENWDGARLLMTNNITNGNTEDGIHLSGYVGNSGDFDITGATSSNNGARGIFIDGADADLTISDSTISNNNLDGIFLRNVTDTVGNDNTLLNSLTLNNNGVGGGAGLSIDLNANNQSVTLQNSTINGNGIGISSISQNVGTVLDLNVINNISINNSATDAVRVSARTGSTTNFVLQNTAANPLDMTGNGGAAGLGIALFAEDGGGNTSFINATMRNFNMTNTGNGNVASGIFGSSQGAARLNLTVENATLTNGVGGAGMFFDFDSNAGVINSVTVRDTSITNSGGDSMNFDLGAASQTDIILDTVTMTGGTQGLDLNMSGTTLTRLNLTNSTVTGATFNGLDLNTSGTAQFLASITNNTITNNGPGVDATADPYNNGINITSADTSRQSIRLVNNNVSGNQEFGLSMTTAGTGRIDMLMDSNTIANNDTGTASAGVNDFQAVNAAGGTICLAMSTNFFALTNNVTNNAAPANFTVELDGNSNGPGVPNFVGGAANFTTPAFGTTCLPAIVAQEVVFAGAGFP